MADRQELILAHLSGEATDDESREVVAWIRESPENAREFARLALMHGQLRSLLAGEAEARRSGAIPVANRPEPASKAAEPRPRRRFNRWATLAAAVVVVAGLVGVLLTRPNDGEAPRLAEQEDAPSTFATIVQVSAAEWGSAEHAAGDRVGAGLLDLRSGVVHVTLDNGVDVTLQGPARFELSSVERTRLTSGVLLADVPAGAEGFRVDTPTAEVVDLGTSFGVDVAANGAAEVLVFDGEVEVTPIGDVTTHRLVEGESIRLDGDGVAEPDDFPTSRFERLWPIASGITASSETVRFIPPWPKRIRFVQSDEHVFVASEGHRVELRDPLSVNISEPGDYTDAGELTPRELPAGTRVRSYVLHYSPNEIAPPRRARRMEGSITFARPVLGLIVGHEELLASRGRFAQRGAGEANPRRQLDLTGRRDGDRIALSEDRRTISFELTSPGRSSDLVRVLVDAPAVRPGRGPRPHPPRLR